MALRIKDTEVYAIDAHSHLGRRKTPLGHGVASFLGDDLIRDLDEVGLDCAVAFPLGASCTDYSEANQVMAEEMAKHPKRIISFCRINPNFGPEATAKSLNHCLGTLKLKGIKLHPEIEFFDPNEAELMEPVYEAARRDAGLGLCRVLRAARAPRALDRAARSARHELERGAQGAERGASALTQIGLYTEDGAPGAQPCVAVGIDDTNGVSPQGAWASQVGELAARVRERVRQIGMTIEMQSHGVTREVVELARA